MQTPTLTIELPRLHPAQRLVRDSPARFRVLCCGRRWGKSRLASALVTEAALRGGVCWVVTPVYALGTPMFDDLRRLAAQIPGCEVNRSERMIRYPGGGMAQVKTGDDPALLRGTALDMVVFDEAAFMPRLQELWLETIRPALADRRGKALFLSTPNGQNYFHQLYRLGQDEAQADWASWQMPTSSNPFIAASEIESAKAAMTERQFSQEFLAEFVESGAVFRNVQALTTATPQAGPHPEHNYTVGIDWGRSGDFTALAVFDGTTKTLAHLERFRGLPFDLQLGRVRALIERWQPTTTIVERNNFGQAMLEQMRKMRLPGQLIGFTTSNESKATLVDSLALALERREITLLNDAALVSELQSYQAETTATGLVRYSAPAGQHDDCVIALMLAYAPSSADGPKELRKRGWARGSAG